MDLQIAVADDDLSGFDAGTALPGVSLVVVRRMSDGRLWTDTEGGEPLGQVLAVAAATSDGLSRARQMTSALDAFTGVVTPVIDVVEMTRPARRKHLADLCLAALAERAARAERQVGELAKALGVLRREHETVLERFLELESSIVAHDLQPVRSLFSQPEVLDTFELGPDAPLGDTVSFELPFNVSGLFELSLHVDGDFAAGDLDVCIETRGVGRPLARWRMDVTRGAAGWRTLSRRTGLAASHAAARIVITFRGEGEVRLGMGPHHPSKRFWLTSPAGETIPRLLAMRAFATNPGLIAPNSEPETGADDVTSIRLWDIENASQVYPDPSQFLAMVSASPTGGVRLVPSADTPVAAILPAALQPRTVAVIATALVGHAEGAPVDFALAAGPADDILDLVESGAFEDLPAFSGWITGDALSPLSITLELGEPARGGEALVLIARVSDQAAHDWFCHAVFRTVRLLVEKVGDHG